MSPVDSCRIDHVMWQEQASVVVLGTGASEKDGLKESETRGKAVIIFSFPSGLARIRHFDKTLGMPFKVHLALLVGALG